ncbi:hypothetical protein HHK36_001800 [Tetracentron sinense]|uniref:Protein kinase domain-containing protein n=1 Tax=Tetracentron sinense TaxID=13715 RepID=A0A835DVB9_TETSI|nr:hypothetical protein HHK36_001800 [Tetracentron sinense]
MIEMGFSEFVGNKTKSEQHLQQPKSTEMGKDVGGWMWMRGETIGKGSFGTVSLAITSPTKKLHIPPPIIAVKSAQISLSHSLEKEMKILSQLNDCPQILRCYGHDITIEKGILLYNVLLEYASGGSLADRIENSGGGLPEIQVRRFTRSLLQGLSHIHGRGCVHCDIKPQNILLVPSSSSPNSSGDWINSTKRRTSEDIAKIADFGLAKKVGRQMRKRSHNGLNIRGTPMYISPESVLYNEHEPHSDIWALGCTVVEMITGKPAWNIAQDTNVFALLHLIGYSQELPDIPGEMSEEAQDFVKRCLVRDSKYRWTADMLLSHPFVATIAEMIDEAEDRIEGATSTAAAAAATLGAFQSPNSALDFPQPKPNFQADCIGKPTTGKGPNWSFSTDSIVVRKSESPVSSQSDKCPVCRKRRRIMGDFKEVVEKPTINTITTHFGPQHLQRYWGMRGFEAASQSFDAIPFGF